MERIAYYNGQFGAPNELTIPFLDRVNFFGDGVYEAAMTANGVIYLADEHIDRFYRSAEAISIDIGMTKAELKDTLLDVVRRTDNRHAVLYWQVTRGTAPRKHAFPKPPVKANLSIMVNPFQFRDFTKAIRITEMEDRRYLYCNVKSLNLLPAVLAAQKAEEEGCYETILHRGEIVTECSHSNVSILKDGVLYTHPNDEYILAGIAKSRLIAACNTLDIPVAERPFTLTELREADEVLVTSTTNPLSFADSFCNEPVGCKAQDTVAKLRGIVIGEYLAAVGYTEL